MKNMINLRLRPIQQGSIADKENYIALQKSVAILKEMEWKNEREIYEQSWQHIFENESRVCFVIEKMPGNEYCGECAVKDISDDIPELEIELMKEHQGKGIGYLAIIDMLKRIAAEYGKTTYCAVIEPDNHASRFLFEKLGGKPAGVMRDRVISEERAEQFTERSAHLLDRDMEETAKKFGVKPEVLLTHFLIYKINFNDVIASCNKAGQAENHREKIDFPRRLSREKRKEVLREFFEDLQQMAGQIEGEITKEELIAKINEMDEKMENRINKQSGSIILR